MDFKLPSNLSLKASHIAINSTFLSALNACTAAPVPLPPHPTTAIFNFLL